jgi:hypothetical protein
MKMLREFGPDGVLDRMGMGKTSFDQKYIKTGRARWVRNGRIKRMSDQTIDRLIAEDIAAAAQAEPTAPALSREACVKGSRASRRKPSELSRA